MKKFTCITVFFILMWQSNAQLSFDTSCTTSFEDISTTGVSLTLGDDTEANIVIPFPFTLDGVSSSDLRVGNNGGILFGTTTGQVTTSSSPTGIGFFPFSDDIGATMGDVYWETLGIAPNRSVVIMWHNKDHFEVPGSEATFEVILQETTNEITFLYQDTDFGNVTYDDAISAGILINGANGSYVYSTNEALAGVTCIHWVIPSCNPPTDLATTNVTTTSIDLAWTDNAGTSNYEYVVQSQGTGTPSGVGTTTTNNPLSISDLTSATAYEVYLRADCGASDFSDWVKMNFATACDPFISFSENFDATQEIPMCWKTSINSSSTFAGIFVEDNTAYSEPNSVAFKNSFDAAAELLLITPELTDLPNNTHRIRFMASGGTDYTLIVGTMSDPLDASTFTEVSTLNVPSGFNQYTVEFTNTTTDNYVAIKHGVGAGYRTINLDDFSWESIVSCADPSDIDVSAITTTDVTVSWTENGSATEWEYVIQNSGIGTPTTGTNTSTNSISIASLSPNTTYEVYVRAKCGASYSYWVGPKTFTTDCAFFGSFTENFDTTADGGMTDCWSSIVNSSSTYSKVSVENNISNSAPNSVELYNSTDVTGDMLLISPQLTDLPNNTHRLRFMAKGELGYTIKMGTMSDITDASTFSFMQEVTLTSSYYEEYTVNFTNSTTNENIVFKHGLGGTIRFIRIDDVVWEPIPSCLKTTEINISDVTTSNVTISWIENNAATAWEYVIQTQGTGTPTSSGVSTMTNPVTDTSLNINTDYEIYVRSMCEVGDVSEWTGPFNFTSSCNTIGDFTENFDTTAIGEIPDCWSTIINSSSQSSIVSVSNVSFDSSPNSVDLYNADDLTAELFLLTPPLTDLANGAYRIRFKASGGTSDTLLLGTMSDPTNPSTFTLVESLAISNSFAAYTINFTTLTTDTYIAFKHGLEGIYHRIAIDDVVWEPNPTAKINSLDAVNFSYYPNPVSNILQVNATEKITSILVFNMLGQEVKNMKSTNINTIDLSNLSKGTFFVKVQIGQHFGTFKIMKK